ncbi:MAG: hypothetical protein KAJ40_00110 [Alphaproteobacteria bacterium]|nr:hypothetical protein [Alphaproteobacteria bacterium]
MSKNAITIEQISLACRHFDEMTEIGVTENLAIRILEHFADVYATLYMGGSATPHHADKVDLWSVAALEVREEFPDAKPKNHFRVEHGTPCREFARKVMELYYEQKLNQESMGGLVERYWKLAVITLEEDERLNKVARSKMFNTPEERWAVADIEFPD